MVPIEQYQRLQVSITVFIILSVISMVLVYHFICKSKDQQEIIKGLSCRIKDLSTRNISLGVRLRRRKETNKILDKNLAISAEYIRSLRSQLQTATKLLETRDNALTDKTWLIIDMQNDFIVFDKGYEELQTKYDELIKSQGQVF